MLFCLYKYSVKDIWKMTGRTESPHVPTYFVSRTIPLTLINCVIIRRRELQRPLIKFNLQRYNYRSTLIENDVRQNGSSDEKVKMCSFLCQVSTHCY